MLQKQVVFPEFLGESEMAVVVVIPSLKHDMKELFERFHSGEEIDYWFSWDLVLTDNGDYLAVLEIDWELGEGLVVAFTGEMWEFLVLMAEKGSVVLLADWNIMEEGAAQAINQADFKPYALLIREVDTGLEKLYEQVKELVEVNEGLAELEKLKLLLEGNREPRITLH